MGSLSGRRILVVEDEFLISAMLCDMLADAEATTVGPASTVADALHLIRFNDIDASILDMNLNGEWSDPVAEVLLDRGIPFLFTTGYGKNERSDRFGAPTVSKPYSWEAVEAQLHQCLKVGTRPPLP